jgi:hypothetical protein
MRGLEEKNSSGRTRKQKWKRLMGQIEEQQPNLEQR